MAGTNVLENQVYSDEVEEVTLEAAVQDSGCIDVTLEESGEGDDDIEEVKDDDRTVARHRSKTCDRETQTRFLSLLAVHVGQCLRRPVSTVLKHCLVCS